MIFNSWAIVYDTDGTLGIAETIIDGFCFPPLIQKSGIPFSQSRNFSVFNYRLYQINNFSIAYTVLLQWAGCWPLSLLIMVGFPRFEIIVLGKSYFLVLTCSLYSLFSGQITYNFSFRILKPKSCIAPNKISKECKTPMKQKW